MDWFLILMVVFVIAVIVGSAFIGNSPEDAKARRRRSGSDSYYSDNTYTSFDGGGIDAGGWDMGGSDGGDCGSADGGGADCAGGE